MTHIEILFKEYDTLREESLTTITVRSAILAFGLATTVGAFAALTLLPVNGGAPARSGLSDLARLVAILGIPAITTTVLWMWFGEYQRMRRAGRFIAGLEQRINQEAGADLLSWESHLQVPAAKGSAAAGCDRHLMPPYYATIVLLTFLGLGSTAAGLMYGQSGTSVGIWVTFFLSGIAQLLSLVYVCRKIKTGSH